MAESEKKFVIITDIKEFTYKNVLLTSNQVGDILREFDSIVMSSARAHNIQIIKSMGDAYLGLADSFEEAMAYSNTVIEKSKLYDQEQKISIKKIALRNAISFGSVTRNKAMDLDDYFGEPINILARIIDITPEGKTFFSASSFPEYSNSEKYHEVGYFDFHGVVEKTLIISSSKLSTTELWSISTEKQSILEECDSIVFRSACVCAILSAQPIPFFESFNIIGIHIYMIIKISQKFGKPVNLRGARDIFGKIIPQLSLGYFAFQGANTGVKILLPGIGGYIFSPLSFGVAYAIGKLYVAYFCYEGGEQKLTKNDIVGIFKRQRDAGIEIAKTNKRNVFKTGKAYYKDILSIKRQQGYTKIQKDLTKMLKGKK